MVVLEDFSSLKITPERSISILVIDDSPEAVNGLLVILKSWENVEVDFFHHTTEEIPIVPKGTDILLVDGCLAMGVTCDDVIAQNQGNFGVAVSITSGSCPDWAIHHFRFKSLLVNGVEEMVKYKSEDFINLMNEVIGGLISEG